MYDIRTDSKKNRLYLTITDELNGVEAALAAEEVIQAIEDLTPGFTVIDNLSEALPISADATKHIKRAQLAIAEKGVKKVVRVVSNIVGAMQMKRIQHETGVTYEVIQTTSLEEAERLLDEEDTHV